MEVKVKKVKGLLAKAPKPSGQTLSKEVSLPDPKPAIAGSSPYRFLCRNGKIFPLNDKALLRAWFLQIWPRQELNPIKIKNMMGRNFFLLLTERNQAPIFLLFIASEDKDKVIRFTMERKDKAGEDEAQISRPGSLYAKILGQFESAEKLSSVRGFS